MNLKEHLFTVIDEFIVNLIIVTVLIFCSVLDNTLQPLFATPVKCECGKSST